MSAVNLATADRKNVRGDWVLTLAGAENRAKLFGPETAKAPVLEAPKPSELNDGDLAPTGCKGLAGPHSVPAKLRMQGVLPWA